MHAQVQVLLLLLDVNTHELSRIKELVQSQTGLSLTTGWGRMRKRVIFSWSIKSVP